MSPFKRQPPNPAKTSLAKEVFDWSVIVLGFVAGTLLFIPQTRPDFLTPSRDPEPEAAAPAATAPSPQAPRATGKLRVIYVDNPTLHPDDVAMVEKAKEYLELKYGLENGVEIGIKPRAVEECLGRTGGVLNEDVVRCRKGFRVKVRLTRAE